jgi:iron complex outermembrane receptor protein
MTCGSFSDVSYSAKLSPKGISLERTVMKKLILFLLLSFVATLAFAEDINLDALIIQASRSEQTLANINKPVDIITRDDIDLSPAKSLPELLGSKPGVYGTQYGGIKNSQVDIGGFGETSITNVLVLVDGRRTNQIDLSGQDWAQIDLNSVDHIEIIRGSGTVLYGDNATGGVINIVTKKGHKNAKPSVTLSGEYGSYQSSKEGFDLNGGLEKLDYQLNYNHEQTTGYRANNNYWANNFGSHFNLNATDNFSVDFSQGYHIDRYQLPGALFISNIDQFGRRGVRPSLNSDHGTTSDSFFEVTPKLNVDMGLSQAEFSLLGSARKRSNNFYTGTSSIFEAMSLTDTYEFQPKAVITSPINDRLSNKLTAGLDSFYAKNQRRSGTLGTPEDLVFISKNTNGVYALDEISLDEKWILNTGARGDWTRYIFDQKTVIAGKTKRSATNEGYEGGLGYKYNPTSKVYVNYSHSYRLPAVDEFYQNLFDFGFGVGGGLNADLTYQTGNEYQWGIKDQTFKDVNMGLNFFFAQYKNEIYLDPNTFTNTNYGARTRHYGLTPEISASLFNHKIEPFANFTWQDSFFKGGIYGGKDIPFVAHDLIHTGVTYRPIAPLSTTLSMDYTGARFAISDPENSQNKIKRYTTVDWNMNYKWKNMDYWLSVRNIFDEKYYVYGVYSSFSGAIGYYPAPTRNVSAGVKVKF